jgi:O-antigen/teichoic acid export membrane protein
MSVERKTLAGLEWIAVAKFSSQIVSWAVTLVVMRLLLPQDYGLMAIVTVVISVLSNVAELGIGASVIQSREVTREELAKISGLITLVSAGVFVAVCAAAPLIAAIYAMPPLRPLIQVAAIQFLISGIATLPQALAQREFEFKRLAGVEVGWVLAASLSTLALAWFGAGVWALVIGSLVGALVRMLMLAAQGVVWPSFRLAGVRRFLAVGGAVMFGRMSWQIVYQADVIIGARRLGVTDIGAYSVAQQLATLPMQRIMGVLNQVALPAVARLQDEKERLRRRLLEGTRLLAAISVPVLWGISAVAPELVAAVLGEKWATAVFPLQVISLVVPLRMISATYATAGLGIGRAALDFRNNLVTAAVLPAAFFVGTYWGLEGLAASWLFAIPLIFALNFPRVGRALSTSVGDVARVVWRPALAGIVMYALVIGARYLLADSSDILRLVALTGAGAIGYLATLHTLDRRIGRDLISLLRSS